MEIPFFSRRKPTVHKNAAIFRRNTVLVKYQVEVYYIFSEKLTKIVKNLGTSQSMVELIYQSW